MTHAWGVWPTIITLDNCRAAVRTEAQTQRCKRNGFALDLVLREDYWAKYVQERISSGLKLGPFVEFDTWEHGKLRHVRCYKSEDSMCVRACVRKMEPAAYARMTAHSYCPIPGRGGLKMALDLNRAVRRAENRCRIWNKYHPDAKNKWQARVTSFDLVHFYQMLVYNYMHDTMFRIFGEAEIRNVIEVFLEHRDGLPIGAGYSSMIANMCVAGLDWLIEKHKGVLGYGRHLDNADYITKSKTADKDVRKMVEEWLTERGLAAHEWAHYPAGHHAIERGGWRIEDGRILPGAKVTKHIDHLMSKKWDELDMHQMCALASLFGYIKRGDSETLKRRWREGNYSKIFTVIGITAKEAEEGTIIPPERIVA